MQQFEQSTLATNTALNSQGSAYRENEQFLKSLQARLNRMANAWTELTLSMGDALLTDGIVLFTESITDLSKGMASVVKSVGLLPPIIGLVSIAIATMNSTMRASVMEKAKAGVSATGLAGAYNRLAASATLAGAATRILSVVLRSIPQVAVFMAVGFAIEKLVSSHVKLREEQKKLQKEQSKLADNWGSQRKELSGLIDEYKNLESTTRRTFDQEKRYLEVSNQLAELLPNLTSSIDDKGQAHLKSAEAIDKEIQYLERLNELKREELLLSAVETLTPLQDDLESSKKKIEELKKILDDGFEQKGNYSIDFLSDDEVNKIELQLLGLEQSVANTSSNIRDHLSNVAVAILEANEAIVDENVKESLSDIFSDIDLSLPEDKLISFTSSVAKSFDELQKSIAEGNLPGIVKYKDSIKDLLKQQGIQPLIIGRIVEKMSVLAKETAQVSMFIDEEADALDGATDAAEENISALEVLYGVKADNIKMINEMIYAYEILSKIENLNTEQSRLLAEAKEYLASMFPHLVDGSNFNVQAMIKESQMMEALSKASGLHAEGRLSAEDAVTLSTISGVQNRIEAYEKEIEALQEVQRQARLRILAEDSNFTGDLSEALSMFELIPSSISRIKGEITSLKNEREKLFNKNNLFDNLMGNKSSSSTASPKPTDTYFTDEFAKSLAELDLALKQSEGRQSKYNETSAEYRNEINTQIDHLKNKQKLMSEEADRLRGLNVDLELQRLELNKNSKEYSKLTEQIDKNNDSIRGLSGAWWSVENSIDGVIDSLEKINEEQQKLFEENQKKWVENLESATDKAIDLIKDHYKDRQKLAQEAIDEELNELERLHEEKTKLLDEDLKKYEEIINAQLRTIDRTSDEEDFSRELSKAEQERLELTQKIHVLSLDDSLEARAKKQELEEELAKKTEEIERMKNRRTKDLRKQNLQDILKNKQKETEEIKSRDQETYETSKTLLEQRKEDETRYWQDKIDNDRYFSELREEGLKGNIKNLTTILQTFALDVEQAMSHMGKTIDKNLAKFNLKDLGTRGLENLQDDLEDTIGGLEDAEKNKTPYGSSVNKKDQEQFNNDFKKYIASKIEWYEISKTNKTGAPTNRQEELHQQNQNLRKKYPSLLDYTIDDLVDMGLASYDKGGMTPSWGSSGKLGILHEEEMIFDKIDTSKILKVANIAENIMRNFKTIDFSKMTPNINQSIQPSNSITISIGSVIGDRKGAEQVSNHIIKRLSAKGVI